MSTNQKLLPCAHCADTRTPKWLDNGRSLVRLECFGCGCGTGWHESDEGSINSWNTRASAATAAEPRAWCAEHQSMCPTHPAAQYQAEPCPESAMCPACYYGEPMESCIGKQAEPVADEWAAFEAWLAAHPYPITWHERGAFFAGYRAAQSGQRAGVEEGWQLVPKEPTFEMLEAGDCAWDSASSARERYVYKAMLAAAPEAK